MNRVHCTPLHPATPESMASGETRFALDPDVTLVTHSDVDEVYDHGWRYCCRACGARWLAGGAEVPR